MTNDARWDARVIRWRDGTVPTVSNSNAPETLSSFCNVPAGEKVKVHCPVTG
jgi:hypothetical protein